MSKYEDRPPHWIDESFPWGLRIGDVLRLDDDVVLIGHQHRSSMALCHAWSHALGLRQMGQLHIGNLPRRQSLNLAIQVC